MKDSSLPKDFQPVPVFTYTEKTKDNWLSESSCHVVREGDDYYWGRPETYAKWNDEYQKILREPIAKAFHLSEEEKNKLEFADLYDYCDALVSEKFQGMPARVEMTPDQWYHCQGTQKIGLTATFDSFTQPLYMARLMHPASKLMDQYANDEEEDPELKYLLYSAHDL